MPLIERIDVRLVTSTQNGAGTDGDVYVGVCGREFYLDTDADDFERASDRTYTFGTGANVNFAGSNDPHSPYQLFTENLERFPVYIRFEPESRNDNWQVELVEVTVQPGPEQRVFQVLSGDDQLRLGVHSGLQCFLFPAPVIL